MIWIILIGIILVLIFTFGLMYAIPRSPADDEAQWEEIQKWKEKRKFQSSK